MLRLERISLILLQLLTHQTLSVWAQLCPAPFTVQAGLCVFVSTAQSHTWCSANRQCASFGGELVNSYESVKKLVQNQIPRHGCNCNLYIGISDLADERGKSRAGWLRINGNGILPTDHALFHSQEPSSGDCLRSYESYLLRDSLCDNKHGFVCEFVVDGRPLVTGTWEAAAFKRAAYNSKYCFNDLLNVSSALRCVAAAMRAGNCRAVLYNRKLKLCRLLLFTNAQVEEEIETSADWVKFRLI